MARPIWCALLAFLLMGLTLGAPINAEVEAGEIPPDLTPEQFSAMSGTYFIKFYSPMCPHCLAFAPKWEGAFKDLGKADTHGFKWAGVNCIQYSDLCGDEAISGYPTLRVYRNGKRLYDYTNGGEASQADLRSFAQEYIRLGDQAFDVQYETAPKAVAELEKAGHESEKKSQAEEKAKEKEVQKAKESTTNAESQAEEHQHDWSGQEGRKPQEVPVATQGEEKMAGVDQGSSSSNGSPLSNAESQPEAQPEAHQETHQEAQPESQPESQPEAKAEPQLAEKPVEREEEGSDSTDAVTVLHAGDFGPGTSVGRWFVLFTGVGCEECEALSKKWEKHDNFARSIDGINWGKVECAVDEALCDMQGIKSAPTLRIYHDGSFAYEYDGSHDTMALRSFLQYAATASNFDGFSLSDLDAAARSGNPDTHIEGAGPNQEPNYLTGPEVQKPNYGVGKPKILDVVQYTLDTLGKPINEDPGKLIFSDSPETHHNFRTWGASDAPPPVFLEPGSAASHATGNVHEIASVGEFENLVKSGNEPWLVKFYSPKCPHCREMASAYEDMAYQMKNELNVAAVNCDTHGLICNAENVTHWPYITLYRGATTLEEYTGPRTAAGLAAYGEKVKRAQIHPIENEEALAQEIIKNIDNNITTFVYLYDQSVMAEDWESLSKVATNIDAWGGKLYRTNNNELRDLAGIKHRGTAFVLADYVGQIGEGQLKWYDYPWSNIPKKIRDADELSKWAFRAKWTSLQYFDPQSQSIFSPYVAVLLTNGTTDPSKDEMWSKHQRMALDLRDFYVNRQIEDQDRIRIDRLRQHDQALLESKFKYARYLMKQPIETPVVADLAFAYIPYDNWVRDYSNHFDVSKHQPGNVIVAGCYNSVYLDEFNLVPIKDDRDVLDDAVELLRRYEVRHPKTTFKSIRHFKTAMRGIEKAEPRPLHFLSKPYAETQSRVVIPGFLKFLLVISICYVAYTKTVRPMLRSYASKRRAHVNMQSFPKHE